MWPRQMRAHRPSHLSPSSPAPPCPGTGWCLLPQVTAFTKLRSRLPLRVSSCQGLGGGLCWSPLKTLGVRLCRADPRASSGSPHLAPHTLAHQGGVGWIQVVVGLGEAHRPCTPGAPWREAQSMGWAGSSLQSWARSLSPGSPGSDGETEAQGPDWPGGKDGQRGPLQ